jgi:hypothetical protein
MFISVRAKKTKTTHVSIYVTGTVQPRTNNYKNSTRNDSLLRGKER